MLTRTPFWRRLGAPRPWIALLAGLMSVAAFAPLNAWWLMPLTLGLLFHLWRRAGPFAGANLGFWFGFGLFAGGVSWVYVSLHDYGQMPVAMAVVAVALLVAYLALFPAAVGYAQRRLPASDALRLYVLMPTLWVVAEWLRGWLLSGFPWLSIGYTQAGYTLSGYAPLGGVYLVSLAVALLAASVADLIATRAAWKRALLVSAVVIFPGLALQQVEWSRPAGEPLRVAAVQGNVPLLQKWQSAEQPAMVAKYFELSPAEDVDLVVWPESAVPYYLHEIPERFWQRFIQQPGDYVFGALEARAGAGRTELFNSAVVFCGGNFGLYRKQHLVPFGEFLPLRGLLSWVLDYLHIPMSDFSAWPEPQAPMCAGGVQVAVSICYEDAFADEMRRAATGAGLLINLSEDAWFGDSLAPHQRLQMAQMRVLETARPMIRASNTGPSALLNERGRILAKTKPFEATALSGTLQPAAGVTPYSRWGDLPVIILAVLLVLGGAFGLSAHRRRTA